MTKLFNFKNVAIQLGASEEEADQITNIGQIYALKAGFSFQDAITVTSTIQGKALVKGISLSDSIHFTSEAKISAFEYFYSLPNAIYANSIVNSLQFSTEIQLYAYKTGYTTIEQALLYTNKEQLLVLDALREHNLAIKKLPSATSDSLEIDSPSWKILSESYKISIEHSSLPFDFYKDSAIICSGYSSWGNTFDKRLDAAFKKDLATIFPSCEPCNEKKSGCLECLDSIMRDVSGCRKSEVFCNSESFDHILSATFPSTIIADVVAVEICE